jgi:MerR family transcriptional regulator, copper efflux regulator
MYPHRARTEAPGPAESRLMTVGELAGRTGMSRKAIRELEGLGLIYSAGRTEKNYRVFDESALWCVRVIGDLRALGLTLKEIQRLAHVYLERPDEPIGPRLATLLASAERRIEERLAELEAVRERIATYRRENAAMLAGTDAGDLTSDDPRRPSDRP